jgi:hypothetical protein
MKKCLLFISVMLIGLCSFAQSKVVSGTILDTTGTPLADAYVKLKSDTDSLTTVTNATGKFRFPAVSATSFVLTVTIIGFETHAQTYAVGNNSGKAFAIEPIKLKVQMNQLTDVVVVASNPIIIKEDTIEYKASAYAVREGAPVEDVIKKLPGVTVDKDGNVTAQGKAVKRVRVNGKDYFGGDVQTATQNLPADIIDNIQIIDDYGDRANVTGVKDGEPEKILNINIQKGKNKGYFGNANVAAGTKERYSARIAANNFNNDRQISLLASANNVNANTFNFSGGGRGGGARGASFGGERGGFADGTTYAQSIGLNFRDTWGKKITSYGSYSFSGRTNSTNSTAFQIDNTPDTSKRLNTSSINNNYTKSQNHRITWNVEYKMDTANYLKVTPYFSYSSASSYGSGISQIKRAKLTTDTKSNSESKSSSPSYGTDLMYNHKFSKRGRNFNFSGSFDHSSRTQDRTSLNNYIDTDSLGISRVFNQNQLTSNNNENNTLNVRGSYSEPISKFSAVEVSYAWNNSMTKSVKDVDDVDIITSEKVRNMRQSNNYDYQFITNRIGLSVHTFKPKYNYTIGIIGQPSSLVGKDIGRNITTTTKNFNYAPNARFVYNFARSHSLTITYGGQSREPGFSQLQPVIDSSNAKSIVIGNPDLRPEFTNRLGLQYNKVGILTGTSLFTNISFDQTLNRIVTSRVNDPAGTGRTISYLNTNGFYGLNGNASYSRPFLNKKLTATVSTSASYDNNISFTDNYKNKGYNWSIRPGARIRLDIQDIIDIDVNGSFTANKAVTRYTSTNTTISTEVQSTNIGINGKNFFFKDLTLGYDLSKTINTGYASNVNANPTLLNVYVEYRFLKNNKATVRLQGFDMFNESTGISREVNGDIIRDVQNNRLGQYFLLSFNLRLQKFSGSRPNREQGDGERREMRGGDGQRGGGNGGPRRNF